MPQRIIEVLGKEKVYSGPGDVREVSSGVQVHSGRSVYRDDEDVYVRVIYSCLCQDPDERADCE